jgi:hypothetical protein
VPLAIGIGLGLTLVTRAVTGGAPVWSPLSLGAALQGWFDAGDPATLWADTGGTTPAGDLTTVARWDDKSGLARHLTQAGATARPTRDASFTPPVLTTDGGDKLVSGAFTAVSQPYSFVVVSDNLVNGNCFFDNGSAGTRSLAQRGSASSTVVQIFAGTVLAASGVPDLATRRGYLFEFNGANSRIFVHDGVTLTQYGATGNAGANTLASYSIFGNASALLTSAAASEFFAFAGIASAGERTSIGTYIKTKWGL